MSSSDGRRLSQLMSRLTAVASVRLTGGVAAVLTALYCVARRAKLGGGFGTFVVAGQPWTDPATTPARIPVMLTDGFDGQFFYRLAHSPYRVEMSRVNGVAFDYGVRGGRVGYPFLAWLGSFAGRPGLVPIALVLVNVLAMGVLAAFGAALARDRGRSAWWGLAVAFYPGFAIVIGRDLSEVVAAAAIFGTLLAVGRSREGWAAVGGAVAVLTREQAVLAIAAIALGVLVHGVRSSGWRPAVVRALKISIPPAVAFLAWQLWVARITGELPATASSTVNSTVPFGALFRSAGVWWRDLLDALSGDKGIGAVLPMACFVGLLAMVLLAAASGALGRAWLDRPWEILVGLAAVFVLVSSTRGVLDAPAEFRQSSEIVGVSWLVLWQADGRRARVVPWALLVAVPISLATFVWRIVVL